MDFKQGDRVVLGAVCGDETFMDRTGIVAEVDPDSEYPYLISLINPTGDQPTRLLCYRVEIKHKERNLQEYAHEQWLRAEELEDELERRTLELESMTRDYNEVTHKLSELKQALLVLGGLHT